jgi:hypothetical protein
MDMPKRSSLNMKQQKQSRAIACAACPDEGTGRSPALHQLRVWSTSLFLAIQGIMARN